MTRSKPIYRKWLDPDSDFLENFLKMQPDGQMLQISFAKDDCGEQARIFLSSHNNTFNQDVFEHNKQVCSKEDWTKAQNKAEMLVKGIYIDL